MVREIRYLKTKDLRSEKGADGKQYLTGHAAPFNTLSEDLGGWREKIVPGAFARALRADPDVRHLINHEPSKVLGRTKAKTTEVWEDEQGLAFRTLVGTRSYERDLEESIARGDIDGCSFAFSVHGPEGQKWEGDVRELRDLDLFDVSIVTYPAYPGTSANLRGMFPAGMPVEIRSRVLAGDVQPKPQERFHQAVGLKREVRAAGPKPFFRAGVLADGTLELLVYEEIGYDWWDGGGVTAKGIKEKIDAAGIFSKISLRINSPGGDAFEGIAIYNLLRAQAKPIECCVDGLAASAASVIAMCGDTITMGPNAMMMIHNVWSICLGNASEMRQQAEILDKISSAIGQTYAGRTGRTADQIKAMMAAETWLTAQECVEQGFATSIFPEPDQQEDPADPDEPDEQEEMLALARSFRSLELYAHTPERFKAKPGNGPAPAQDSDELERRRMRLRAAEAFQ